MIWENVVSNIVDLVTIAGIVTLIVKIQKPIAALKDKVAQLEAIVQKIKAEFVPLEEQLAIKSKISKLEEIAARDLKRFGDIRQDIQALVKADYTLLTHAETHNSTGMISKAKDDLVGKMIDKTGYV
jgi:hypothetical protein